jgi:DNA primase
MVNHLLANIVNSVLGAGKQTARGNMAYHCPYCHHSKPKLEINFDDSVKGNPWHCWVCNKKGTNLIPIFKEVKASDEKIAELRKHISNDTYVRKETKVEAIQLPKEFKPLIEVTKNDLVGRQALAYLKKRGVKKSDLLKYNIGYCEGGVYNKMIIIPSYSHEGSLNYFVARNFNPYSKVKYKNPPLSKDIVPFEVFINWKSPLILVEGMFDALAVKRNAIPLLGKHIQKQLMKKIVTSEVQKIFIALDKDAQTDALRFCEQLLNEGKEVYLVDMDDKDPSEMGFEKITELIQNTHPLSQYDLMERKLQMI